MKFNSKHRKAKDNPYTLSMSQNRYYVSFTDGQDTEQKVEITKEVFEAFLDYESIDLKMLNEHDRHIEHILDAHLIADRENIEEKALIRLCIRAIKKELDSIDNRSCERFILYYFEGYTMTEIAELQNVSIQRISQSIKSTQKHLLEMLSHKGLNFSF